MNPFARIGKLTLDRFVLVARRVSMDWDSLPLVEAVRFSYLDFTSRTREIELNRRGYLSPISLRAGTCDVRTSCQVIGTDGYGQELTGEPSVIIDAGAHS